MCTDDRMYLIFDPVVGITGSCYPIDGINIRFLDGVGSVRVVSGVVVFSRIQSLEEMGVFLNSCVFCRMLPCT